MLFIDNSFPHSSTIIIPNSSLHSSSLKPFPSYSDTRNQVAHSLFYDLHNKGLLSTNLIEISFRDSCPECGSVNIQGPRFTISPPFYCGRCHHRFDKPIKKEIKNEKPLRRDFFLRFKDEIDSRTQKEREKQASSYLSGEDVITVCSRCHLPIQQGMILCKICNKHLHNSRYNQCWECFNIKNPAEGQVKCKFCEVRFHSPDDSACNECSILRLTIYCQECNQTKFSLPCYCYNCDTFLCEDCSSKHVENGHDVVI